MWSVAARSASFLCQNNGGVVCAFDDVGAVAFNRIRSLTALSAFYLFIMLNIEIVFVINTCS